MTTLHQDQLSAPGVIIAAPVTCADRTVQFIVQQGGEALHLRISCPRPDVWRIQAMTPGQLGDDRSAAEMLAKAQNRPLTLDSTELSVSSYGPTAWRIRQPVGPSSLLI